MSGPSRSIKPSEGSRSRVAADAVLWKFNRFFAWKSLPDTGFGKNVVIDAHRCSRFLVHLK